MLDQCHNIEPKVQGQIRSVMNVQETLAKAMIVDHEALSRAQHSGDILGANAIFMDAFNTDVRGWVADLREERGLPRDPVRAFLDSGYLAKVSDQRAGGSPAGWAPDQRPPSPRAASASVTRIATPALNLGQPTAMVRGI
jgi:L-rhamnose isomerase/sugar isomerase